MVKLTGAAVILCAAIVTYREMLRSQCLRRDMLQQLQSALEEMASAIRTTRLPLPEAIARQTEWPGCGVFFHTICRALEKGVTLSDAWEESFSSLRGQEGRILRSVTLRGDEPLILGQLEYAAAQLKKLEEQARAQDLSRRRIQLAASLSLACLLMIILL